MTRAKWKWFGHAGHFICSSYCRFHLCTLVGKYLVSTVGEYLPDSSVREILAQTRGIKLHGQGDEREADWLKKVGFEEIGYQRTYETMVFLAGELCKSKTCGCGLPSISGSELDFHGYTNPKDATVGHHELCDKWSKKK